MIRRCLSAWPVPRSPAWLQAPWRNAQTTAQRTRTYGVDENAALKYPPHILRTFLTLRLDSRSCVPK
jgi:hypothetical protein